MNFYCAPESQENMIEKVKAVKDGDYAVKLNGTFTYGVTPCKDYDEKKTQLEKIKKKYEEDEKKRLKELPLHRWVIESLRLKGYIKHELTYAPRTLD